MKICFVAARFPFPPEKGDSLRAYHQLRELGRRHEVTLVALHDRSPTDEELEGVKELCERIHVVPLPTWRSVANAALALFGSEPLQVAYYRSARLQRVLESVLAKERFDAIHVSLVRMAPYVWERTNLPVLVDLVDALGHNFRTRRDEAKGLRRMVYAFEYRRVAAYEQAVAKRFERLAICSAADRDEVGAPHARVLPNGVDLAAFPFRGMRDRAKDTAIFTGNMAYPPNEEAARWFAERVWPQVKARRPTASFVIAGANPPASVRALSWAGNGIHVLGRVPNMGDQLALATVAVAPLLSGSGIQNKVLEAMATGTPVVATPIANRGVQGRPGRDLLVARAPDDLARAVDWLFDDEEARGLLADNGRALVERRFLWSAHASALEAAYQSSAWEEPSPSELASTLD